MQTGLRNKQFNIDGYNYSKSWLYVTISDPHRNIKWIHKPTIAYCAT